MSKRTFAIKMGIKRNYGKHEIYYELAEQIDVSSTGELRAAYLNLQSLLDEQIKVYEEVGLPHVKLPNGTTQGNSQTATGNDFTLETLKVESQDGKRRLRACGGKFTKWGVPVYEDCDTVLPIETLNYGVHNFRDLNLTVKVEMDGDKPARARAIK